MVTFLTWCIWAIAIYGLAVLAAVNLLLIQGVDRLPDAAFILGATALALALGGVQLWVESSRRREK